MKIKFQVMRVDSRNDSLEKEYDSLEKAEERAEALATAAADLLGDVQFYVRKVWKN
jgi:hypothetical protein